MTILALAQACASRLQIVSPSSFVGSTDNNMILLKAMIEKTAKELRDDYTWSELGREHTFTLATDTASYALPGDTDQIQTAAIWNRTQHYPLIGPVDALMWQNYKSGIVATLPRQRFRVKGWATNQLFIDPTPTSSENGQTCAFEYQSKTVFRPKTWVENTSWVGMRYCSYNGYIFDRGTAGAGTTGSANAPTPSDLTDGGITWTLYTGTFDTINHDNDESILDEQLIIDGACWRWKMEKGFDYENLRQQAEQQVELAKAKPAGGMILSINGNANNPAMIGPWSYPVSNYGI